MSTARVLALAAALLLASACALAGPLSVRAGDGTSWIINDEEDPAFVERHLPSGALDAKFGRDGRAVLEFQTDGVNVSTLRVETSGRIWVAGTSLGAVSVAAFQRLQPDGQPDRAWGVGGQSTASPAGQQVMLIDMLPQADASAWVLADLNGADGQRSAGLWRLRPDGSLDYRFGLGGLWKPPGSQNSRGLSLAAGPDGAVAVGIESGGATPRREVYIITADGQPTLDPANVTAGDEDDDDSFLAWNIVAYRWHRGLQTAPQVGAPLATVNMARPVQSAPSEVGHTALNPFAEPTPAASAPVAPEPEGLPWGWLAAGLAALVIMVVFWRRGS